MTYKSLSLPNLSALLTIQNLDIVIQKIIVTNVAVDFNSAVNIKTFTQVPLPPPTRPTVSNSVMWKCLTLFSPFSTGAQLVPQDNIVHVVEPCSSTVC